MESHVATIAFSSLPVPVRSERPFADLYLYPLGAVRGRTCVLWGLAAYREIASPANLADCNRMIKEAAEYNIKTEYIEPHGYFAWTRKMLWDHIFGDEKWSKATWTYAAIFLPQLNLAWRATGDVAFLRETQRWYDACGGKQPQGHANRDLYLGSLLMEMEPSRHALWEELIRGAYAAQTGKILPDGTCAYYIGRSSITAMGCVSAQRWLPDVDMTSVARHILEKLDEDTFRFVRPGEKPARAGADDTIEQWTVESQFIDGDSLTAWLAAYWEGRWRGYW